METFDLLYPVSQAVRKSCLLAWIPRGPNFWKPLTCGYVAAGAFFFQAEDGIRDFCLSRGLGDVYKRQGPSWAQARFLEFWKSGTWKSGNLGAEYSKKIRILKIQIRVAQNVGKVWLSREKILLARFRAIWGQFFHRPEKSTVWSTFVCRCLGGCCPHGK